MLIEITTADKIRYFRISENLTQDDIADYIRVSVIEYSNYEKGVKAVPFDVLVLLSERYGVILEELSDDCIYDELKCSNL